MTQRGLAKILDEFTTFRRPSDLESEDLRMRVFEAVVNTSFWGRKVFRLDHTCRLQSHYPDEPRFDSAAKEAFFEKFARNRKTKWRIEREGAVLDLGDTVMIPDFAFRHADGREAYLEIVGFWTPEYLLKKLDKIARAGRDNLIIAVPESLNCSEQALESACDGASVLRYKMRLLMKDVLPMLGK